MYCFKRLSKTMGSKKFVEYLILNLSFQRDTTDFSLASGGFLKIITKAIWAHFVRWGLGRVVGKPRLNK